MADQKEIFKSIVVKAIEQYKSEKAPEAEINVDSVRVEIPPKPEMGDLGIPMFAFAKEFHSSPMAIANDVAVLMKGYAESDSAVASLGEFLAAGPYVNVKLNKCIFGHPSCCNQPKGKLRIPQC